MTPCEAYAKGTKVLLSTLMMESTLIDVDVEVVYDS